MCIRLYIYVNTYMCIRLYIYVYIYVYVTVHHVSKKYCGYKRQGTLFSWKLAFRKGNQKIAQKCFHNHYFLDGHAGIDDWIIFCLNNVRRKSRWKRYKTLGNTVWRLFFHCALIRKRSTYTSLFFVWEWDI